MMDTVFAVVGGVATGILLLVVGFFFGRRHKQASEAFTPLLPEAEKDRMLDMLRRLEKWTHDYSGDVTDYQNKLVAINRTLGANKSKPTDVQQNRLVLLLGEIIGNNENLQQRLENAESLLEQQTRQLQSYLSEARTDGLTGLSNRRALDKRMDELFASYQAGGRSFSIALIDIDKFKSINDSHGHPGGDAVLKNLATILRTELNDAEMVARFGGEEFAVILFSPLRVAASRLNEIRRAIESTEIDIGHIKLRVSASIGLSEPINDTMVPPVLRRADEALYAAKNRGRNRVYFHDGDKPSLVGAPEVAGDDDN